MPPARAALYIVIGRWSRPIAAANTIDDWLMLRPVSATPQFTLRIGLTAL